jgi:hypothetical protein
MTLKWQRHASIAGNPATDPNTAETTGTSFNKSTALEVPPPSGKYVLPICSNVLTLPPTASSKRTNGIRHCKAYFNELG